MRHSPLAVTGLRALSTGGTARLLRFDLSCLPDQLGGGLVSKATLSLWVAAARQWMTVDVTHIVKAWLDHPADTPGLFLRTDATDGCDGGDSAAIRPPPVLEIDTDGPAADGYIYFGSPWETGHSGTGTAGADGAGPPRQAVGAALEPHYIGPRRFKALGRRVRTA